MKYELADLLRNTFLADKRKNNLEKTQTSALVQGERRDVAVLFLDLTGFTAFSELLDHETVHDITKALMDELVAVALQYSGYIDKIEGDRIMVLFGAIASRENNSKTAILCAFKMLETVKIASSILKTAGVPIAAKIGINSGPVTVAPDAIGHLTAMGNTVNIASRIQEKASENSILVTNRVYSFCSENILWAESREISVKGIGVPLKSWRPISINYLGNPINCKESIDTDFLIKKDEYSILNDMLKQQTNLTTGNNLMGGVRHLVVELSGEAGSGKTRLVSEFLTKECKGKEILVLNSHAIADAQPAYYLWSTLLQNLLLLHDNSDVSDAGLLERLSKYCPIENIKSAVPFLKRLISSTSDDLKLNNMGSKALSSETKMALRDLLTSIANNHQLVILLDDLQWLDSTDSATLNFILNNCNSVKPIYFILCRRSDHKNLLPYGISKNNSYILYSCIELSGFNEREVFEFSSNFLEKLTHEDSSNISEKALSFLAKHSAGNPFFLQELILHLVALNGFVFSNSTWGLADSSVAPSTPNSLTDLLQARLDRLPETLRKTILNVSILGSEFKLEIINKIEKRLNLKPTDKSIFQELVKQQFLENSSTQDDTYRFRHSFIKNIAYKSILSHNLKILHRAAAESIQELIGGNTERMAPQLAEHWEKAGDIAKSIEWASLAQKHSSANYQYSSVLKWGDKLETWLIESKQNKSIEILLATYLLNSYALLFLRKKEDHFQVLKKMHSIATNNEIPEWIAEAEIRFSYYYTDLRDIKNSKKHLTKALQLSMDFDLPAKKANALSGLSVLNGMMRQHEDAINQIESAIEIFSRINDHTGEARALGNLAILHRNMGNTDKAIPILEKVLQIFKGIGDIRNEAVTSGNLGAFYSDLHETDKAQYSYSEAIRFFHKLGERMPEAIFSCNLANLQREILQFTEARQRYIYAYAISKETGDSRLSAWIQTNLGLLNIMESKFEEAGKLYDEAYATFTKIDDKEHQAISLSGMAYIHFLTGDVKSALKLMADAKLLISELELLPTEFQPTYFSLYKLLAESTDNTQTIPWPEHWEKPAN